MDGNFSLEVMLLAIIVIVTIMVHGYVLECNIRKVIEKLDEINNKIVRKDEIMDDTY